MSRKPEIARGMSLLATSEYSVSSDGIRRKCRGPLLSGLGIWLSASKPSRTLWNLMRIDLNVPYGNKDEAKRLGAWWDAARRTWYVKDMEDLTPFMRWITKRQDSRHEVPDAPIGKKAFRKQVQREKKRVKLLSPKVTTGSPVFDCGCDHIPPWEDCEHTAEAMDTQLDAEAMQHLRSI